MNTADLTRRPDAATPRSVRIALAAAVGLLGFGAAYLYAVRGNAMILDLANGLRGMLCF
jgi:hypothetical protein